VIRSFHDEGTADIFNRRRTKAARRTCPEPLWRVARRKLDQLNVAVSLASLRLPPGNRLEALGKDRLGQYSIRVNDQYRVCFVWTERGAERVEVTDYH
jgi:proteic killer suppression protein